jgi:hypothetical protein
MPTATSQPTQTGRASVGLFFDLPDMPTFREFKAVNVRPAGEQSESKIEVSLHDLVLAEGQLMFKKQCYAACPSQIPALRSGGCRLTREPVASGRGGSRGKH